MAFLVPICPPGAESDLARHFRVNGWKWDEELLLAVIGTLATEDVSDVRSLSGLDVGDVSESCQWPADVCAFVQGLASDSRHVRVSQYAAYLCLL